MKSGRIMTTAVRNLGRMIYERHASDPDSKWGSLLPRFCHVMGVKPDGRLATPSEHADDDDARVCKVRPTRAP